MITSIKKSIEPKEEALIVNRRAIYNISTEVDLRQHTIKRAYLGLTDSGVPIPTLEAFKSIIELGREKGLTPKGLAFVNNPNNAKHRAACLYEHVQRRAFLFAKRTELHEIDVLAMTWEKIDFPRGQNPRYKTKSGQLFELGSFVLSIFPAYPQYNGEANRPKGLLFPGINSASGLETYYSNRIESEVSIREDHHESIMAMLQFNFPLEILKYFIIGEDGNIEPNPDLQTVLRSHYSRPATKVELDEISAKEEAVESIVRIREAYDPFFLRSHPDGLPMEASLSAKRPFYSRKATETRLLNKKQS